jgi:dienelactone hydrolase
VLKAVLAGLVRRPNEPAFAAAVAFYPGCDPRDPPGRPLETDTLILIGEADDWTPAARCAKWRYAVQTDGHMLQMKIYPGARHGSDAPRPPHYYAGHYVGQDPVAQADRTPAGSLTSGSSRSIDAPRITRAIDQVDGLSFLRRRKSRGEAASVHYQAWTSGRIIYLN